MNGKVEIFFGTLNAKLDNWEVDSLEQLNVALVPFRFWYNHVRSHQHLESSVNFLKMPVSAGESHLFFTQFMAGVTAEKSTSSK
jgi:hypothetical protein